MALLGGNPESDQSRQANIDAVPTNSVSGANYRRVLRCAAPCVISAAFHIRIGCLYVSPVQTRPLEKTGVLIHFYSSMISGVASDDLAHLRAHLPAPVVKFIDFFESITAEADFIAVGLSHVSSDSRSYCH